MIQLAELYDITVSTEYIILYIYSSTNGHYCWCKNY